MPVMFAFWERTLCKLCSRNQTGRTIVKQWDLLLLLFGVRQASLRKSFLGGGQVGIGGKLYQKLLGRKSFDIGVGFKEQIVVSFIFRSLFPI